MADLVPAPPSIHYRRRWFYVLWTGLLLLMIGVWILWETPKARVQASLAMRLELSGAPKGCRVQAWAGPKAQWPGSAWGGQGAFADLPLDDNGQAILPLLRVPIAQRRWLKADYLRRGTSDLIMLKITPPGAPSRYCLVSLAEDISSGLLRPKWRLTFIVHKPFGSLTPEGQEPSPLP